MAPMPKARGDASATAAAGGIMADPRKLAATVATAGMAARVASGVVSELGGLAGPLAWGVGFGVAALAVAGAVLLVRRSMSEAAA